MVLGRRVLAPCRSNYVIATVARGYHPKAEGYEQLASTHSHTIFFGVSPNASIKTSSSSRFSQASGGKCKGKCYFLVSGLVDTCYILLYLVISCYILLFCPIFGMVGMVGYQLDRSPSSFLATISSPLPPVAAARRVAWLVDTLHFRQGHGGHAFVHQPC